MMKKIIILGAGPVGLAAATYLMNKGIGFEHFTNSDHIGVENSFQYGNITGENLNIGGIGGTANAWGAQIGFFDEHDFNNWHKFNLDWETFLEARKYTLNILKLNLELINANVNEDKVLTDNAQLANIQFKYTYYPEIKKVKKIFKEYLKINKIRQLNSNIKFINYKFNKYILYLENGEEIILPSGSVIILALGCIQNAQILINSNLREISSIYNPIDHISSFISNIKICNHSNKITKGFERRINNVIVKRKFYFSKILHGKNLQGIFELHPNWTHSNSFEMLENYLIRLVNFLYYKLNKNFLINPKNYKIFIQIEQVPFKKTANENDVKLNNISALEYEFVYIFIQQIFKFLKLNGFQTPTYSRKQIIDEFNSNLFQAFHPSCSLKVDDKTVFFDGRVGKSEKIYVLGSSLFPNGGWVNPTFEAMTHAIYSMMILARKKDY